MTKLSKPESFEKEKAELSRAMRAWYERGDPKVFETIAKFAKGQVEQHPQEKSMKHTPGPWNVQWGRESSYPIGIHNRLVNVVTSMGRKASAEASANAHLIAAAPDLLAACEAQQLAIDHLMAKLIALDDDFMPTESKAWSAVVQSNAAIAKATGVAA